MFSAIDLSPATFRGSVRPNKSLHQTNFSLFAKSYPRRRLGGW